MATLTHLDPAGRPTMVDVGGKPVTARRALAEGRVSLPPAVAACLVGDELDSRKGPVYHSAILAGTLAAKRTAELIPLCHTLPLERLRVWIETEARPDGAAEAVIRCEAALHGRTGVEMEALTAVAVAALTVVDMCKALSHEMVIHGIRLLEKEGGRRTVRDGRRVA